MKKITLTSKELLEKVDEVKERLISEIKIEGKRQSTVDAKMEVAKKEAEVLAVIEAILELAEDGSVETPLGTVEVVDVAQREGRNPSTKETITIPAHKAVKVKSNRLTKKRFK